MTLELLDEIEGFLRAGSVIHEYPGLEMVQEIRALRQKVKEQQREIERLKKIRKCDRHGKGIIRHAACSCGLDKHEVADD